MVDLENFLKNIDRDTETEITIIEDNIGEFENLATENLLENPLQNPLENPFNCTLIGQTNPNQNEIINSSTKTTEGKKIDKEKKC